MTRIILNGRPMRLAADPATPLLWVLRDDLGLTGTKYGCGMGLCGACTVHVNSRPVRSCATPLSGVEGKRVTTVEGVDFDRVGRAVEDAWVRNDVAQCGWCQAGQLMSAIALLRAVPRPTDRQIDEAMAGNLCRCGTYQRIRAAIRDAAQSLQQS